MDKHTPGPWTNGGEARIATTFDREANIFPPDAAETDGYQHAGPVAVVAIRYGEANARLIAAAPELLDGCNALLGLLQLVSGRDDLTPELREILRTNHRVAEAEAAVAKALESSTDSKE